MRSESIFMFLPVLAMLGIGVATSAAGAGISLAIQRAEQKRIEEEAKKKGLLEPRKRYTFGQGGGAGIIGGSAMYISQRAVTTPMMEIDDGQVVSVGDGKLDEVVLRNMIVAEFDEGKMAGMNILSPKWKSGRLDYWRAVEERPGVEEQGRKEYLGTNPDKYEFFYETTGKNPLGLNLSRKMIIGDIPNFNEPPPGYRFKKKGK